MMQAVDWSCPGSPCSWQQQPQEVCRRELQAGQGGRCVSGSQSPQLHAPSAAVREHGELQRRRSPWRAAVQRPGATLEPCRWGTRRAWPGQPRHTACTAHLAAVRRVSAGRERNHSLAKGVPAGQGVRAVIQPRPAVASGHMERGSTSPATAWRGLHTTWGTCTHRTAVPGVSLQYLAVTGRPAFPPWSCGARRRGGQAICWRLLRNARRTKLRCAQGWWCWLARARAGMQTFSCLRDVGIL